MPRRRRFLAPLSRRGFTPIKKRQLQLPGHLRPFASETHGRFALLPVRPFAAFAALRPRLTSRSDVFAPSPFQAQGEISLGKNVFLRRTTAGSTPPEL